MRCQRDAGGYIAHVVGGELVETGQLQQVTEGVDRTATGRAAMFPRDYDTWNNQLLEDRFFSDQQSGQAVRLNITREVLDELGREKAGYTPPFVGVGNPRPYASSRTSGERGRMTSITFQRQMPSASVKHAQPQQIEVGPAIHLPLDHL